MKILILNGPNLSRLDLREQKYYGEMDYAQLQAAIKHKAQELKIDVEIKQSDSESELISWLHDAADKKLPVIFNPAAFTHYSIAIRDAAALLSGGLIEVHLSNPLAREEFRHTSFISGLAQGTISGFGAQSYVLALQAIATS